MIGTKHLTVILAVLLSLLSASAQSISGSALLKKVKLDTLKQKAVKSAQQVNQAAATGTLPPVKSEDGIPLVGDLSDSDEQALGRETAGRLLSAYPLVKNDSLQRYVNLVGVWVAQQSKRSNLAWTFGIIESDDINAFSTPGGYVFITNGLYKTLINEAELAAVLGHEIAHVNLRHHVRLMQKERLIAKGGNFLAGRTKHDALKELAGAGAEISARAFDKDAEFACDRLGAEYAARAGYDPFAYIEVLDRMGVNNQTDRLSLLFKTHPHPRDRIAALESAIGNKWSGVTGIVPQRWIMSVK